MSERKVCRVIVPAKRDACGAPATKLVVLHDGTAVPACGKCVMVLEMTAQDHHAPITVKALK